MTSFASHPQFTQQCSSSSSSSQQLLLLHKLPSTIPLSILPKIVSGGQFCTAEEGDEMLAGGNQGELVCRGKLGLLMGCSGHWEAEEQKSSHWWPHHPVQANHGPWSNAIYALPHTFPGCVSNSPLLPIHCIPHFLLEMSRRGRSSSLFPEPPLCQPKSHSTDMGVPVSAPMPSASYIGPMQACYVGPMADAGLHPQWVLADARPGHTATFLLYPFRLSLAPPPAEFLPLCFEEGGVFQNSFPYCSLIQGGQDTWRTTGFLSAYDWTTCAVMCHQASAWIFFVNLQWLCCCHC